MKDIEFLTGDFVVWNGKCYRAKPYWEEHALFAVDDTSREHEIGRISKDQAEDHYTQFARCDYKGVRYTAIAVRNGQCIYSAFDRQYNEPIEEMNEIWLQRNRTGRKIERETLWLAPSCPYRPSSRTFYAEEMANGNVMTSHLSEEMSLTQTIERLNAYYRSRIRIEKISSPIADEVLQTILIDDQRFDASEDYCWGIVCISPREKEGAPYIHEIVNLLNQNDGKG